MNQNTQLLLEQLQDPNCDPLQRAKIGIMLAINGDPRRGVGLRPDKLPDIEWLKVPVDPVDPIAKRIFLIDKALGRKQRLIEKHFYISRYLITYAQFHAFLQATGQRVQPGKIQAGLTSETLYFVEYPGNYPRNYVNLSHATDFADWLNEVMPPDGRPVGASTSDWVIRLPTRVEWQLAANNGNPFRRYPWGRWKPNHCNSAELGINDPVAVGLFPHGQSICGALDMAGNLSEWTSDHIPDDIYSEFYEDIGDISDNLAPVLVLGGSFQNSKNVCKIDLGRYFSHYPSSIDTVPHIGFRCVIGPRL